MHSNVSLIKNLNVSLFSQSLGATCCGLGRQTYVPLGRKNSRAWKAQFVQKKRASSEVPFCFTWCCWPDLNRYGLLARGILSPLRLPISPQQQNLVEAPPRIELGMKVLQTSALPLGYGATNIAEYKDWQATIACQRWSGKRDSNSRHLPWQGNALPLSHSRMCPALSFEATIKLLWWEL